MNGPPLTGWLWVAAFAPVALLFVLVASGKLRSQAASALVLVVTLIIGATVFRAGPASELVALGKGLWLGTWILMVVWPALLLYRIASVAGLERIGAIFASVLPRRRENLLIVAWLFPAFIQGVAGFGTPIAVAAPLLVAMGWSKTRAVLYPLIGYHWAVTFGSMGSSFYMASLTAHLEGGAQQEFALLASGLLGMNCLLAGAAVLLLDGGLAGLREGARVLLVAGVPMVLTLMATASVVPAVATLAAGTVGLLTVSLLAALTRRRARRHSVIGAGASPALPSSPHVASDAEESSDPKANPIQLLAPYGYLLATALPVFLIPASRQWVRERALIAFDFPATSTGWGWAADAVTNYTPIAVFGHPGFYILMACLLGYATYRLVGLWADADTGALLSAWVRSLPQASLSILLLAAVATVLIDTGMVSTLARGMTEVTGRAYPLLAPWVGAMGSFMTGSTTTSNALFAALQRDVSQLLGLSPAILLAAQTAGGNVGNAVAPVVILIGVTAIDAEDEVSTILRRALVPAGSLLTVVAAVTLVLSFTWS